MNKKSKPHFNFERVYKTDVKGKAKMLFSFRNQDGAREEILLPYALFRQPNKLILELTDHLVPLPHNFKECRDLCDEIMLSGPAIATTGQITNLTGWAASDGDHFDEFVLPNATTTQSPRKVARHRHIESFNLSSNTDKWYKGDENTWIEALKEPSLASPYIIFAISAGLSGPALAFFSAKTGLLFNFAGPSGSGKTTLLRVAQSVYKSCGNDSIAPLSSTQAALEEQAANHNHLTLCLDEFGAVLGDSKQAIKSTMDLAYSINEGKGKGRYSGWHGGLETRWQTTILTTAEHSLNSIMGANNNHVGAMIRYIDIPVPSATDGGIFTDYEVVNKSSSELILTTERVIDNNYGFAIEPFVDELMRSQEARERLELDCSKFAEKLKKYAPESQDRYREAFGRIYATGKLAAKLGIVPFSKEQLSKAIIDIFIRAHRLLQETASSSSIHKEHISPFIELGNDPVNCITAIKGEDIENTKNKIIAIRRFFKNEEHLFIPTEAFKKLVPTFAYDNIIQFLREKGIILSGKNSTTRTVQINNLVPGNPRPSGYLLDWVQLNKIYEDM